MASTDVAAVPRPERRSRSALLSFLHREGLVVGLVLVYAGSVAWRLPLRVGQDAWFALIGGREIAGHGLPKVDSLTYWTAGRHWVDQQWLGQVVSYALYRTGGLALFALTLTLLTTASVAIACLAARRRGASPRAVTWVVVLTLYLFVLSAGHVRTQSFAYPLFAAVLLLLLDDLRRPGKRVLIVLPILVVWANIHGSVVLGAALAALYGLLLVRRPAARARGALLGLGGVAAVLATPYGLDILGYYHSTLLNPNFKTGVSEWRPPTPSLAFAPLYVLAAAALWLLGRRSSRFSLFEGGALLLLLALAFDSKRNLPWLALAAMPLLAPALDDVLPAPSRAVSTRLNVVVAGAATVFAVAGLAGAARPGAYAKTYPGSAATAVARAAAADPTARVFANEQYADWLLMTKPALRGRVAYDIRFELLSRKQLESIVAWRGHGANWATAANGARLVVIARRTERRNEESLRALRGTRVLYQDSQVAVLARAKTR